MDDYGRHDMIEGNEYALKYANAVSLSLLPVNSTTVTKTVLQTDPSKLSPYEKVAHDAQMDEIAQSQDERISRLITVESPITGFVSHQYNAIKPGEDLKAYQHRLISAISHKLHYVDDLIKSNNQTSLANESKII
jgi:hypothetical protein